MYFTNKMRLIVILFGMFVCCQAVFKPVEFKFLKSAVFWCLRETVDGSCPNFAASNDATGNPYGPIGEWDVSLVTSLRELFDNAYKFNSDLSKWDVSGVTDMYKTFFNCGAFTSDLSGWDVSKVTTLYWTFRFNNVFNSDLSGWDVSKVTTLSNTFNGAWVFNSNLSSWDVSHVTNLEGTFEMAKIFNGDISTWNVSQVTTLQSTFKDAKLFNSDISKWKVSKVTNLFYTFRNANVFNSDLAGWDVSQVTTLHNTFYYCWAFNGDISNWDVSKVESLYETFSSAKAFSGDISKWNTSKVTTMYYTLYDAESFNSDVSKWDTSKVTDMSYIFKNTEVFDQDVSNWDISQVTRMRDILSGTDLETNEIAHCTMVIKRSESKFQNCSICNGCSNSMKCKRGFQIPAADWGDPTADVQSFTCGCDTGSYKNVDWATESDVPFDPDVSPCFLCPVGTYQDQPDQLTCETCPPGRSTTVLGSTLETECLTAIDIKQKFLEERNPDLVPAYNIAMRGSECGYKMVEYEEIGGDCTKLEARPSGVQPDTYDTPYQFTIVGDDTCAVMCAKLEVCQAYHADDVCTGFSLNTEQFASVFITAELTIGNMHLTSLSTHTILVPDYKVTRSDPLVTKNITTSSIHVLGLRRYCNHPLIYIDGTTTAPGTHIYYNEGEQMSAPYYTAENIYDKCAAVCRELNRSPTPYGALRTSTSVPYTWSEIVCKGFEISFSESSPNCYMATSSSGNGVTPNPALNGPDCFAVGDPELYKWKNDTASSETCYVKKHLDLL